jgi:hypothetical protein
LLIRGGRVIDASQGLSAERDVAISGGTIARVAPHIPEGQARQVLEARGKIVSPGLIDVHVHVYDGVAPLGIPTDPNCIAKGVTTPTSSVTSGVTSLFFMLFTIALLGAGQWPGSATDRRNLPQSGRLDLGPNARCLCSAVTRSGRPWRGAGRFGRVAESTERGNRKDAVARSATFRMVTRIGSACRSWILACPSNARLTPVCFGAGPADLVVRFELSVCLGGADATLGTAVCAAAVTGVFSRSISLLAASSWIATNAQWIIPTGGGYFFVPSMTAIREVLAV